MANSVISDVDLPCEENEYENSIGRVLSKRTFKAYYDHG